MSSLPPPTTLPVGWHPAPHGDGYLFFDGVAWHSPEPTDDAVTLPMWAGVGALAVLLVSLILVRLLGVAGAELALPPIVMSGVVTIAGYGPVVAWCWWVRRRLGLAWRDLGWRFRLSDLGWGPLTWFATIAVQVALVAAITELNIPMSGNIETVVDDIDLSQVIGVLVAAVFVAPIVEELCFRGVILRSALGRMSVVGAIGAQGVVFGIAHLNPALGTGNIGLIIVLSAVGCSLGVAAHRLGRIGASVIAHMIFNAVAVALALSGIADRFSAGVLMSLVAG